MTYDQCKYDVIAHLQCVFSNAMFISILPYHLQLISILFGVNMCCSYFFTSRLVNWVINDPLYIKV